MRKLMPLLIIIPFFGISQTNHELEFNSATLDYVEMLNTSAVIANKTSFSISGWVNPQSNTNHGGIMGFRNNIDADFYLLQLQNTNNIEARFRNSLGVDYDIVAFNALDFNQWQHLAFSYDGSYIRLYKDGIFLDSTAANGTIIQTAQSFRLGSLNYQGLEFYLTGRLDEIRLWDVALSQTEINNWMCTSIDSSHPNYVNLMGYWNLNEGIGSYTDDQTANGNNGTLFGGTTWQASSSCLTGAVLCGDVNEDGAVDQIDVTEINNFILGSPPLVFNSWAADVNCDGTINILDITMLNSFISGIGSLNCCSTTASQCVVTTTPESCPGSCDGSAIVTLTGGTPSYTYLWSPGGQTTQVVVGLCAGIYTVIVMDANGSIICNDTVTILQPLLPTITFTITPPSAIGLCDGSLTANVSGGTPPYTYWWSPCTSSVSVADGLCAGDTCCVNVTDANGCSNMGCETIPNVISGIIDVSENTKRTILKIINVLGEPTKPKPNTPLFYIYDDGTVEKRITIE